MKTLQLSVITAVGIVIVVAVGIYILISPSSGISHDVSLPCNPAPNISRDEITLKQVTWISVTEIEKNRTKLDCTTITPETLLHIPELEPALSGADKCRQGQDGICSFPSGGVSLEMSADGIISVKADENYQASITQDEAHFLLNHVTLEQMGSLIAGDVNYDGKYYQILLFTSDESGTPQVGVSYAPNHVMDDIPIGKSVNYTITVQTLATFGKPAKVQLYPVTHAQDSGLTAKIIPDVLFIPERSKANATLVITAGPHAQNGTYQIGFYGKIGEGGSTRIYQESCPCIRVGGSDWTVRTYWANGYGGWSGKNTPQWLQVETVTDKKIYHTGETVEIKSFIINNSPDKVTLGNEMMMFVNVYNQQVNGTQSFRNFYDIDAQYDGKPIVLEPHSTTMIARPFYWDQSDLRPASVSHKVSPANYHVDVSFGNNTGAVWDNDIPITIK